MVNEIAHCEKTSIVGGYNYIIPLLNPKDHLAALWTHSECQEASHNAWNNLVLHKNEQADMHHIEGCSL